MIKMRATQPGVNRFPERFNLLRLLILIAGITLFGCVPDKTAPSANDAALHVQRGQAYQEQGQYRAAIIEARNAMQKAPEDITGHVLLASIYNELGQSKSALSVLEPFKGSKNPEFLITKADAYRLRQKYQSTLNLLERHPDLADSHPRRYALYSAEAYSGRKQFDKAEAIYRTLLSENPDNVEARLGLARLHGRRGNAEQTSKVIEQILASHPNHAETLILKARVALNQQDLDSAESLLTDALTVLPSTDLVTPMKANTLRTLSEILTRQGRSAEAMVYSRILSDAFPGAQEIETQLKNAIQAYKDGDLDKAENILSGVLDQAPGHELSGTLLGVINYLQGDVSMAEQYFKEHLDEETANPLAKQAFALTQLRLNHPRQVMDMLEEEAASSKNPDTLALYGIAAISSISPEKGVEALRKALLLEPTKTRLHLVLARYYNTGVEPDRARALKEIETAFKNTPEDPYIQSALAQQLLAMGRGEAAKAHIESVVQRFGNKASSHLLAGTFFLSLREPQKAQQYFARAAELDTGSTDARFGLAEAALAQKDWNGALQHYRALVKLDADLIKAYKGIINTHVLQQQSEQGVEELEALAKNRSSRVAAHAVLAEYHARQGDIAAAQRHFDIISDEATETHYINRLGAGIQIEKAQRALATKDYNTARQAVVTALESAPESIRALTLLTSIEIEAKQYAEAQKIVDQIRQLSHSPALADTLSGDLALAQGRSEEAVAALRKAWQTKTNDIVATKLYSALLQSQPKQASAQFLDQWQAALPDSLRAKTQRANRLQDEGKLEEAAQLYREILEQVPNAAITLNNLAWTYAQLGDKRALETARRAYELAPKVAGVVDTYGWILVKNEQAAEGIKLLEQAVEIAPDNEEIRQHLEQVKQAK